MQNPIDQPEQATVLTTARLTLRAARASDLDDLFQIYSDPATMRYWSTEADTVPEQTKERLDRMVAQAQIAPLTYFVLEREGKAIGTAGRYRGTEVGFILHRAHWRQGLVSEALKAIIPYLWQVLDVSELTADADPNNDASVGLLTSLGFQITGTAKDTFCINGVYSDSVYMTLRRPI